MTLKHLADLVNTQRKGNNKADVMSARLKEGEVSGFPEMLGSTQGRQLRLEQRN